MLTSWLSPLCYRQYYEAINSSELMRRLPPDVETPEWGPNVTASLEVRTF
jgi:hypothetical protein